MPGKYSETDLCLLTKNSPESHPTMLKAEIAMTLEPIEFDRHGDIRLVVGRTDPSDSSQPVTFVACSRALARVSSVFDRMLYGNFAEARRESNDETSEWIVKLPEDKAAAFTIFLNIAHTRFDRVPRTTTINELYDLVVLTHYYDCTQILGPWVKAWLTSISEDSIRSDVLVVKILWIAWELGCEKTFTVMARRMLMECDGSLDIDSDEFKDLHIPADIMERIIGLRLIVIASLLDIFRDMVENLIVVDEKPRWCRHAQWMGPHRCESMILGSMTFCLARAGLWPLPAADEVQDSLVSLYRKLTNLIIHDIGQTAEGPSIDHRRCNPGGFLLEEVERAMKSIESPVTDSHRRYLRQQAQKLNPS